jgi:molecular chaperone DnaK (HSP70)
MWYVTSTCMSLLLPLDRKEPHMATYAIGIDLGTTNSVIAYTRLDQDAAQPQVLSVPQLVAPATVESRLQLPSFLYLRSEHEADTGNYELPWQQAEPDAVGELARQQAAAMPMWTVAAAKSWLCYSRVDRHQPLLPWGAPGEVPKVSPVDVSRRYLAHLVAAWHHAFPAAPIAEQRVVLTVPASFDASARELTREAAHAAGLPAELILLEEPQAALYAWLADRGERWRRHLGVGAALLVCDVGGGTTDFTLIGVDEMEGALALQRLAVGTHTLVGGDNMDVALAHVASTAFVDKGLRLDAWQSVSLWHACRTAKEALLALEGPQTYPVAVLGRGRRLVGGTVSVDLQREAVQTLLLDGFFPVCKVGDRPERRRASGFRELGLPYESDVAVTRHLASFLSLHGADGRPAPVTHVLFNGGVFKATRFRDRLLDILGQWYGKKAQPRVLAGAADLDYAVARGAAYYGFAKAGRGIRIRGGTARSYYVGIETAGLAIPGAPRPLKALCVVPFGMEEGTEIRVPSATIGLVVGEPCLFRFFSSAVHKDDQPGDVLEHWSDEELSETDPLSATLPVGQATEEEYVPVQFEARLTELGVFELWCVNTMSEQRWKLEFSVREDAEEVPETQET